MTKILLFIWISVLVISIIMATKYKQCHFRLPLTYLLLGFSILSLLVIQNFIPNNFATKYSKWFIPIVLLSFVLIFCIFFTKANSIWKVLSFMAFVLVMSLIFNPIYNLGKKKGVIVSSLITIIILFIILSICSILKPELISYKFGNILFFSLIGLIAMRLCLLFFNTYSKWWIYSSYLGIIIFSGLVLYDTKLMLIRANDCSREFDYINNILSFFLDFINLLSDMISINSR